MSFYWTRVQRYKRGAQWDDGSPRMCTRCGIERTRRQQAVMTALLRLEGNRFKVPVGYCNDHVPEEVA